MENQHQTKNTPSMNTPLLVLNTITFFWTCYVFYLTLQNISFTPCEYKCVTSLFIFLYHWLFFIFCLTLWFQTSPNFNLSLTLFQLMINFYLFIHFFLINLHSTTVAYSFLDMVTYSLVLTETIIIFVVFMGVACTGCLQN